MSTKPFKDIEQIIKDAAEGYEHPYDEDAWSKMEVLLDGQKDRRKPFFWLWWLLPIFIGVGVGGYFILRNEPGKDNSLKNEIVLENKESFIPSQKNDVIRTPVNEKPSRVSGSQDPVKASDNTPGNSAWKEELPAGIRNSSSKDLKSADPGNNIGNDLTGRSGVPATIKSSTTVKIKPGEAAADPELTVANKNEIVNKPDIGQVPVNDVTAAKTPAKAPELPGSATKEKNESTPVNGSPVKQKQSETNPSPFYFIASAGAEGSGVNIFSAHTITARGGLTIGYQLSKKVSLQTGFFAGSKKYIAGPGDYNAKDGSYWNVVDITHVDANCLVYEVPLNVRYDFKPGKTLNVFASTGLSSYIMKKEEYAYTYNSNGYSHYGQAAYKGNQHLFSVLRLSAGIEKNISNKMSLHAAPALSFPLAGVGEGEVKLYSTEIMIGVRYQPSKKIKNK